MAIQKKKALIAESKVLDEEETKEDPKQKKKPVKKYESTKKKGVTEPLLIDQEDQVQVSNLAEQESLEIQELRQKVAMIQADYKTREMACFQHLREEEKDD